MNEENKPAYYAIIPSEVRYCEELKFAERLLYGEITALAGKEGYCYCTNGILSKMFYISTIQVSKLINSLKNKKYINTDIMFKESNKQIEKRKLIPLKNNYNDYVYQRTFFLYIPKPFYTIKILQNSTSYAKYGIIKVAFMRYTKEKRRGLL